MMIKRIAKRPFCNTYSGCGEYKKQKESFFPKSTIDYYSSSDTVNENALFENDFKF